MTKLAQQNSNANTHNGKRGTLYVREKGTFGAAFHERYIVLDGSKFLWYDSEAVSSCCCCSLKKNLFLFFVVFCRFVHSYIYMKLVQWNTLFSLIFFLNRIQFHPKQEVH